MQDQKYMDTTIIKTYPTRIEAEIEKGVLTANGIKTVILADDEGGMAPYLLNATGFVKLIISKTDLSKAQKLLGINK